jgi:hypothetical protein
MDMSVGAQEHGVQPAVCENSSQQLRNHDISAFPASANTAIATPNIPLPPELRAMIATFNTAELLEHILHYLPALQLLTAKATCRNFRNAIEASPSLRREISTLIRLGDVDEDNLFKTDASGDSAYPIKGLDSLAFFYPSDGEKRLFVRIHVAEGWFEKVGEGSGFAKLRVVDQVLEDVTVGWHCSCFENVRSEVGLVCEDGRVAFGDVLKTMEAKHRSRGLEGCGSLVKFWLDGSWGRGKDTRDN